MMWVLSVGCRIVTRSLFLSVRVWSGHETTLAISTTGRGPSLKPWFEKQGPSRWESRILACWDTKTLVTIWIFHRFVHDCTFIAPTETLELFTPLASCSYTTWSSTTCSELDWALNLRKFQLADCSYSPIRNITASQFWGGAWGRGYLTSTFNGLMSTWCHARDSFSQA